MSPVVYVCACGETFTRTSDEQKYCARCEAHRAAAVRALTMVLEDTLATVPARAAATTMLYLYQHHLPPTRTMEAMAHMALMLSADRDGTPNRDRAKQVTDAVYKIAMTLCDEADKARSRGE